MYILSIQRFSFFIIFCYFGFLDWASTQKRKRFQIDIQIRNWHKNTKNTKQQQQNKKLAEKKNERTNWNVNKKVNCSKWKKIGRMSKRKKNKKKEIEDKTRMIKIKSTKITNRRTLNIVDFHQKKKFFYNLIHWERWILSSIHDELIVWFFTNFYDFPVIFLFSFCLFVAFRILTGECTWMRNGYWKRILRRNKRLHFILILCLLLLYFGRAWQLSMLPHFEQQQQQQ